MTHSSIIIIFKNPTLDIDVSDAKVKLKDIITGMANKKNSFLNDNRIKTRLEGIISLVKNEVSKKKRCSDRNSLLLMRTLLK